jgi:hypothetical protein
LGNPQFLAIWFVSITQKKFELRAIGHLAAFAAEFFSERGQTSGTAAHSPD